MKRVSFISLLGLVFLMSLILAISAYGADKLIVKDSLGTTNVFKVTDTGLTYIGITTPLPVGGYLVVHTSFSTQRFSNDPSEAPNIEFGKSRGTESSPTAVQNGDETGRFLIRGYDGTAQISSARFGGIVDGVVSSGVVPQAIYFKTGTTATPTESMRITSSGRVGIGTSSPGQKLHVVGNIYASGTVSWGSSRELKEDIKILTTDEAFTALHGLVPTKYQYKADRGKEHLGFIAEDVPDLVANKDRKSLDPMNIVAVLTKVIQEQQKTIRKLEEKMADLEKEVKLKGSVALIQY